MLPLIVPAGVETAECHEDEPAPVLFPEERALAAGMGAARRREFATVRHCARRAGLRIGVPPAPLLTGPRGAPRWPDGVVGSLTHCRGYRAAALARAGDARAIGIDAEPHRALPDGMLDRIALPEERAEQRGLRALDAGVCWDRLLFCAKEAVYKVWSPLTRAWLGFHEASVSIAPATAAPAAGTTAGTFRVRLLKAPPDGAAGRVPPVLEGRWIASGQLLLTAIVVPAGPPARTAGAARGGRPRA
ncbi:4'-phosphopantetheinyl transferase superfamily protein [Streptomyces sp. NPDC031705]|uniref:4'-phosphopantetheinyl transferase family protein n=1 Tax=unclassified Streptomyces TaxID=2593676 RepID=UPI0033EEA186